ncbi:hypothetical protein ES702_02972 [subsurface metagenome]
MYDNNIIMTENENNDNKDRIYFVAKPSTSGRKILINIPAEKHSEINKDLYYKVYLIPVHFNEL